MESRGSSDQSGEEPGHPATETHQAEQYERYVKKGKQEAKNGNLSKSIELFRMANTIHPSEKLQGRIEKLEEALTQLNMQNEQDDAFVDVLNSGFMIYKELYNKLFEHQKEGIAFLYRLYRDGRKGGILADDMGLGKTIQIIAFLSGMFDSDFVRCVLLIMPTTLISNWVKEFAKWTPGMRVSEFHGISKKERARNLERIQRKSGILITTYQMLINNWQQVSTYHDREFVWDYIVLDEAHKIKTSSTKTAKACHAIPAKNRILLTGTPIQNNLREMWSLYDFACQGSLLGTAKTFKIEYENPITRAREKDATPGEKALGLKISENLMKIIQPYFLRRTKSDVQDKKASKQADAAESISTLEMPSLTRKNDLILWVYLSSIQEEVYRKFISLDQIKELLMTTRSPLAELTVLKKLCDHPRLLSARACIQLGLEGDEQYNGGGDHDQNGGGHDQNSGGGFHETVMKYDHLSDEILMEESGKLRVLIDLLHNLTEQGHKTLVFSQSRKMLDMVARILNNQGFKVMRIDGTVPLPEREKVISKFQRSNTCSVLLLTTQVGGVGLTLTSADRVVIFDPSWNPATDAQAVDRAYRIGQQENVVIYRLITCGTVEEKIYRRQIFKDSLIRQTTGDKKNPFRYFSKQDLKELFSLEDTRTSTTQIQLQNMHSAQRKTDTQLDDHIAFLHTLAIFGISDHDLLYANDACSQDDSHHFEEHEDHYIQQRVQKAHELMQLESQMKKQLNEQIQNGTEGAWLRQVAIPEKPKERSLPKHKPYNYQPPTVDLTEEAVVDISSQMTSMVIENSEDEVDENPSLHPIAATDVPRHKTTDSLLLQKNIQQHARSPSVVPSDPQNIPSSESEMKPNPEVKAPSALHSSTIQINDSALKAYDSASIDSFSEEHAEADLCLGSPSSAALQLFQTSGLDMKEDCFEGNMSVSKSQLGCDFNLILEDSIDNQSQRETEEMGSLEISRAPREDAILVLEDSVEGGSPVEIVVETSMRNKRKAANTSGLMDGHHFRIAVEDSYTDYVGSSRHEMQDEFTRNEVQCNLDIDSEEEEVILTSKKKNVRKISSDSESENSVFGDEGNAEFSPFNSPSVKGISASTPKLEKNLSDHLAVQKRLKRRSIASQRSLVHVAVEDLEDVNETIDDSSSEESEEEYIADEAEEAEVEEQPEDPVEPAGETLPQEESPSNGADEYESDSFIVRSSDKEDESTTEETFDDEKLGSGEQMDCLAPETDIVPDVALNENLYSTLVQRGKELQLHGNIKEALDCFLKALDIKSGDPEVMLMTLNLYKRLS